jgi:hypothetical protein
MIVVSVIKIYESIFRSSSSTFSITAELTIHTSTNRRTNKLFIIFYASANKLQLPFDEGDRMLTCPTPQSK